MRRKFQHFLLFLIILHSSWAYDVFSHVDLKPFSRNEVGADYTPTINDVTPGSCSIEVTWTCSSCPATFDGFNVYWQQTGKDSQSELVNSQTNSYYIDGLISSQSYSVWVASIIEEEETASSKEQQSTLEGVPYEVTNVQTETISDSVIKVLWKKTSNPCPIKGYYVTWTGTAKWTDAQIQNGQQDTDENTTSIEAESLAAYTKYDFFVNEITTDDIYGDPSEPSSADTEQGAAGAPTSVTSLTLSSSSIEVNWTVSEAANGVLTGYHISCQLLPNTTDHCDITTEVDVFTATPDTLLECGDYTISVQAHNDYGLGESAETTSITDEEEPPPFTDLIFNNITSKSVNITWTPLDTNCPVTKYNLHVDENVLWKTYTNSFDRTIPVEDKYYILENLTPYSNYNISIKATTTGGPTDYFTKDFDTLEDVAEAPANFIITSIGSTTAKLSWSESPAINGELQGYHIKCSKTKRVNLNDDCDITTSKLTYTVSGLDACSDYTFKVYAVNGLNDGEAATTKSSTDTEVPGDMGTVTPSNQISTNITISFTPPETSCDILYYDVVGLGVAIWDRNLTIEYKTTLEGGEDTYVLQNLNPFTSYTFNMSATTAGGTTNEVSFKGSTSRDVPSEPTNFKANVLDSSRVRLTWDEPEFQNGFNLMDYYLSYELLGVESDEIALGKIIKTYTLGDDDSETLLPCQSYNIKLRASNEMGIGPAATIKATLDAVVPNTVRLFRCKSLGPHSAELTWNVQPSTCRIKYYYISLNGNIEWGGTSNTSTNISNIPSNRGSITLTDLIADTSYDITMEPGNDAGLGEQQSCNTFVTDLDVPDKPVGLNVTDRSKSELVIKWLAPEMRNGFLTSFKITWGDNGKASVKAENDTSKVYSYTIKDLDDDKIYEITVSAENSEGLSDEATTPGETDKSNLAVILGTVIPVVVILIAVAVGFVWYNQSHKKKKSTVNNDD